MAYFGRKLPFAVVLVVAVFAQWTASPQEVSLATKDDSAPKSQPSSGVFLYTYRTPAHMQRSSPQVFQQAVDGVSRFLSSKNVPVRKIVQAPPAHGREQGSNEDYENLSMSHNDPMESVFDKARASGARYALFLVVDRPAASWIKLKMRCFDLSGKLLWEIQSDDKWSLTGKRGLERTLRELEDKISSKTDELSLGLEEAPAPVATATSTPVNTPGQSSIVPPQPSPAVGEKPSAESAPATLTIEKGVPVSLLLLEAVSSKNLKVGDEVRFRVVDPVVIDHLVVAREGGEAWGRVTALQPARRKLRSAEITIAIQQLALVNGSMAPLDAVWRIRRHLSPEHAKAVADEVFQTYLLALPFVPLMHGDDVRIAKGREFSAAFGKRIVLDRTELEGLQPPTEAPRTGPANLTFYDVDRAGHAAIWCGKVKLGELRAGTHYRIELPAGTYWVRADTKKSLLSVVLEPGREYFLRVSAVMASGNNQLLELVKPVVAEIQLADTRPLDSKQHHDFGKADPALLRANPAD